MTPEPPYARATVVRVDPPVSSRVGDKAVVTSDGRLEGWVGGACAEPIVVREALAALAEGRPRLVRITPAELPLQLHRASSHEPGEPVALPTPEPERNEEPPRVPGESDERDQIVDALLKCAGNQTRTAKMLGISRGTLIARMESYALPRPRKRTAD